MAQVAEPFFKLAGVRVEPRTRRKHDTPGGYGVAPCVQTLSIVDVATRPRDGDPAAARRLRRRLLLGRRRRAVRVSQHLARRRRAVDRRGRRHHPAPRRRSLEPDAGQLAAVDARPEDAAGQGDPRRPGTAAGAAGRLGGAEHPGDRRPVGRVQHLRGARRAHQPGRRGAFRVLRYQPARAGRRDHRRRHPHRQAGRSSATSTPRPTASTSWSPRSASPTPTRSPTGASRTTSRCGTGPGRSRRSPACRSPTACPSMASRPGRASTPGAPPSRPRWSGPRRWTAATGTSRCRRATRS